MDQNSKRHSAESKAKVAIEGHEGNKSTNEMASEFAIHPVQIKRVQISYNSGDHYPTH